jgi:hypothetical protein
MNRSEFDEPRQADVKKPNPTASRITTVPKNVTLKAKCAYEHSISSNLLQCGWD